MSIIKPHTSNRLLPFFAALFGILLVSGIVYSGEYRAFADVRHEVERISAELTTLEARRADLTDSVFRATNPAAVETAAAASGLSLERHPAYLPLAAATR